MAEAKKDYNVTTEMGKKTSFYNFIPNFHWGSIFLGLGSRTAFLGRIQIILTCDFGPVPQFPITQFPHLENAKDNKPTSESIVVNKWTNAYKAPRIVPIHNKYSVGLVIINSRHKVSF